MVVLWGESGAPEGLGGGGEAGVGGGGVVGSDDAGGVDLGEAFELLKSQRKD